MTHPFDDGDPHLVFLQRQKEDGQNVRRHLQNAIESLIMESSEKDFTILFNAIDDMKRRDPRLYQSFMGQTMMRAMFVSVEAEDAYRCSRTLDQRHGAA